MDFQTKCIWMGFFVNMENFCATHDIYALKEEQISGTVCADFYLFAQSKN